MDNAIWFDKLLKKAMPLYLNSGQTLSLHQQIKSDHSKARASGLSMCPLKTALERNGVAPTNGGNTSADNHNLALVLSTGGYIAEMYQAALVWYASRTPGLVVRTEETLSEEKVHGRIDIMVSDDQGHSIIVDFKYSLTSGGAPGGPRLNYGYQLLAYRRMWGDDVSVALCVIGKGKQHEDVFKTYGLVPEGAGFIFKDTDGKPYKGTYAGWNKPELLNYTAMDSHIAEQLRYMDLVRNGSQTEPPVADPLNEDEGWQCLSKDYKKMTVTPSCPYSARCHGIHFETKIEKEGSSYTWSA